MTRIPGSPEEKLALLSGIDQRTLPHLVGDILYFSFNHRNIRVMDGPGDGKRDIHSVQPDGTRHIAQCKFHANTNATVSSDETDELILALMKFGSKSGLFATTGRISPQAKREYLDNYSEYSLDFLDGINLVDYVLSSPVLSAVWFDGKSIIETRHSLELPFIIRRIVDDHPIEMEPLPDIANDGVAFKIQGGSIAKDRLEPYRSPLDPMDSEHDSKFIHGQLAYCIGNASLHSIPEYRQFLISKISTAILDTHLPVTVRFGAPSLVTNSEAISSQHFKEEKDFVNISQVEPISYVIDRDRSIIDERAWVVLSDSNSWKFPDNLSVAESPWAGWLNRQHNTMCMEQLETPIDELPYDEVINKKLRLEWLNQSLFILISRTDYEDLLNSLSEEDQPSWVSDYGLGGFLVGWLHPLYLYEMEGGIGIRYNNEKGKYEAVTKEDLKEQEFNDRKLKLQKIIDSRNLSQINSKKAILIAAAADDPLIQEVHHIGFDSANLFHYFSDIPSPVFLQERSLTFVRMWEISVSPQQARETISKYPIELDKSVEAHWDAKKGPKTNKTFLMSSLTFSCPPDMTCDKFFQITESKRDKCLDQLADHIRSIWSEAQLSTVYFWSTEVGFRITEDGFEGNPWVAFINEKPQDA
jgi:hypothetical protein